MNRLDVKYYFQFINNLYNFLLILRTDILSINKLTMNDTENKLSV